MNLELIILTSCTGSIIILCLQSTWSKPSWINNLCKRGNGSYSFADIRREYLVCQSRRSTGSTCLLFVSPFYCREQWCWKTSCPHNKSMLLTIKANGDSCCTPTGSAFKLARETFQSVNSPDSQRIVFVISDVRLFNNYIRVQGIIN
jgi:hypothetical protein